ncbi:hypothetical protein FPV67DRAFT_1648801 [Lyophyllum atratum]|nr:hypothetical protein FPV67DRAFT_1648801 [Lyophyllum atratum]
MKFTSTILSALPLVLASWTAMALGGHGRSGSPSDPAGRNLARLTARNLQARHAAEWEIYRRDFEPETLGARRSCKTSSDCLGMICVSGTCQ